MQPIFKGRKKATEIHRKGQLVLEKANFVKSFLDLKSYQNLVKMDESQNVSRDSGRTGGNLAKMKFFQK